MKQSIASLFFDILSYIIGNIVFVFLNLITLTAGVYKLRLAEVNSLVLRSNKFEINFFKYKYMVRNSNDASQKTFKK